jgi:hypothetical protein
MEADSFNDLALRVLAGEATDNERRALEAELSAHPERREEFGQLKRTHDLLRATAPLTGAVTAKEPELPAHRLNELRTAVRQHFGPATQRTKAASASGWISALRWIFAGGGATALATIAVLLIFSNRSIEVGLYGTYLMRGGDAGLSPADVPDARLLTFDQDAPFDQWQSRPLAWYEHAKVWVDNEHDLLHVVHRVKHGHIVIQSLPLAPTTAGQRDQIKQVVELLEK